MKPKNDSGTPNLANQLQDHLAFLYGPDAANRLWPQLKTRLAEFRNLNPHLSENVRPPAERLTERDAILITYGDQISEPGQAPLQTLAGFLEAHLVESISTVHLLPFYPYSSDDGFSVIDYRRVDPNLGTWDDVDRLGRHFRLMFDAVINHISRQSAWFQAFVRDEAPYNDFFITVDPATDLSAVVRPRALPLLTRVETARGARHVWTTFSDDQIDLNYANPQTLFDVIDVLLFYVERGAEIIRLDAIAYLWKEVGTPSIHLPQTHRVIKLFRSILDAVAPGVLLITETNVPHRDNISYFGDGSDEAQLVYQFSLAPLVLNAIHTGSTRHLQKWAAGLTTPSPQTTFFNFLASHDGIGLMPARDILSEAEIQALVDTTQRHGGYVSSKTNPDGSQSPYELNINYFDALSNPSHLGAKETMDLQVRRFMAAQAMMLALKGVPGIYMHSLLGSRSDQAGVKKTGRYRSINRQKFERDELERELSDPTSLRYRVFQAFRELLEHRRAHPAFHPNGGQQILEGNEAVFGLLRTSPDGVEKIACLHNVSNAAQSIQLDLAAFSLPASPTNRDLVGGVRYRADETGALSIRLEPYQVLWLHLGDE
ncbi:MAG: sugar phosphorylase [Anaerolineae bacterium]